MQFLTKVEHDDIHRAAGGTRASISGRVPLDRSNGEPGTAGTGKELQDAWNNQEWKVSNKPTNNGGLGATIPGKTTVGTAAVSSYASKSRDIGHGSSNGVKSLILHETGHAFGPGLGISNANSGTATTPNPIAERAANAQAKAIGRATKTRFSCGILLPTYGC